jgi:hypothetical protein
MIPAIRGQLHACRRKAGPHYNLIGGFALMGAGVGVGGGTYATTGRDARIVKQVAPLAMARGLFAVTGGNVALDGPGAKTLAPSTGTFALSGRNAALGAGLPANSGTFALTGKPAGMTIGGAGRFALTGNAAIMAAAAPLGAGAFTMGGVAARLASGDSLTGTSGTYALTGRNAVLGVGLRTGAGSFALTGNAANEHYGYNLPSVSGTFALTGRAATMVTGTHGIGGGTGTFTLTGRAAALGIGLQATSASFALTGRSAVLADGRNTHVNVGTYSLTGNAAALSRRLLLNSGTFALTGRAASMADALGAGSGTFALTGTATAMNVELHPVTGAFALTGNAAMMGQTVTLNPSDKSADITLSNGNLSFTGTTTPNHNYSVRGTQAGSAGRYFEVTFSTIASTSNAPGAGFTPGVGVANLSQSLSAYPGDPNAAAWFSTPMLNGRDLDIIIFGLVLPSATFWVCTSNLQCRVLQKRRPYWHSHGAAFRRALPDYFARYKWRCRHRQLRRDSPLVSAVWRKKLGWIATQHFGAGQFRIVHAHWQQCRVGRRTGCGRRIVHADRPRSSNGRKPRRNWYRHLHGDRPCRGDGNWDSGQLGLVRDDGPRRPDCDRAWPGSRHRLLCNDGRGRLIWRTEYDESVRRGAVRRTNLQQ